jgi:hypothetical protein
MHCANGLYIVDKMTEFFISNSKDQLHVLKEVIENVYMFKSRVMDYYPSLHQTPHMYMLKLKNFLLQLRLQGRKELIDQDHNCPERSVGLFTVRN